jgi:hypothetical protein
MAMPHCMLITCMLHLSRVHASLRAASVQSSAGSAQITRGLCYIVSSLCTEAPAAYSLKQPAPVLEAGKGEGRRSTVRAPSPFTPLRKPTSPEGAPSLFKHRGERDDVRKATPRAPCADPISNTTLPRRRTRPGAINIGLRSLYSDGRLWRRPA